MAILVTGATGFIGAALSRRLLDEGGEVRVLVRSPGGSGAPPGTEPVVGDITNPGSCSEACEGVDTVFHCAGMLGGWHADEKRMREVNVGGTGNMLRAAHMAGVEKFIHVSSCGILGPLHDGEVADESHPYNPVNAYERAKAEAEKLALSYTDRLPLVVIRPEFVYGPGDLHLLPLFRAVQQGRFVFFGGGRSLLHPTYIDDVLEGMLLARDNPKAEGDVFNIAGERPVTVKGFVTSMAKALGTRRGFMSIPVPMARAAGAMLDISWGRFARPPLTEAQARYLSENRAFGIAKARDVLGYVPGVPLGEGMRRAVEWYHSKGLLGGRHGS